MEILLAQLEILWQKPEENLARLRYGLRKTPPRPGSLIVLPEMIPTGFTQDLPAHALPEDSFWEKALIEEAKERNVRFLAGIARQHRSDGNVYNEAILISANGIEGAYQKMRPFPPSGESGVIQAGEELCLFNLDGLLVCPLICYDLRFPELFRYGLMAGAEAFIVIANWPEKRRHHWRLLLQARAIENQAYVIGVNRCGSDPHFNYAGESLAFGPAGEELADLGQREAFCSVEVDRTVVHQSRAQFPAVNNFLAAPLPV